MKDGILAVVGNTPLIHLTKVFPDIHFNLYAKLETFNPGGSTKDRPALNIIRQAVESGVLLPGGVVIESSSGNMGVGLAQACSCYGLRFICVVDPKTTQQNINLIRAYGAEVDLVSEPDPVTGEFLRARITRVQELLSIYEGSFWPNQYANVYNPASHRQTMREISTELAGRVDYLFCAVSTCGTMRGCAEYVRENGLETELLAVDAVGSVIFGGQSKKRLIPGHGAAVRPALYHDNLADACIHVNDIDCVVGCRLLARTEAILAGGSSGAVLMAVAEFKDQIPAGANCVMMIHDRGERYLDTIYSDEWVENHFGDISHLWEQSYLEEQACLTTTY
jgi:N-(2-amino-2-carboxyethyl)-L-glutamate synthase